MSSPPEGATARNRPPRGAFLIPRPLAVDPYFADRLALEKLPPYAPMLNPVESLWSWLKWERLSNFGPQDAHELDARVIAELTAVREDQAFLRNLFHASDLPLPRALLS